MGIFSDLHQFFLRRHIRTYEEIASNFQNQILSRLDNIERTQKAMLSASPRADMGSQALNAVEKNQEKTLDILNRLLLQIEEANRHLSAEAKPEATAKEARLAIRAR